MHRIIKFLTAGIAMIFFMISGCGEQVLLETSGDTREIQTEEAGGGQTVSEAPGILVHICGAVRNPGVYGLSEGSRVCDAVRKAGGFTEDAAEDYLNLAGVLRDGSKVVVPSQTDILPRERYGTDAGADQELVDINRAGPQELMTLPGIGEAKAEAVIAYREEHGGFSSPEEIMLVPGIKEAAYEKLKDKITAGP